jgi:hypothetical protein
MDERRLTKEICEADVGGNAGTGRSRQIFLDHIREFSEKGQVKSTRNRRACMRNLMTVEEAKGSLSTPKGNGRYVMYVCM